MLNSLLRHAAVTFASLIDLVYGSLVRHEAGLIPQRYRQNSTGHRSPPVTCVLFQSMFTACIMSFLCIKSVYPSKMTFHGIYLRDSMSGNMRDFFCCLAGVSYATDTKTVFV